MRSINEIKQAIGEEWMDQASVQEAYGFAEGTPFGDVFGPASIENLLFYVVAVAIWAVEQLTERTREEIDTAVGSMVAHRPKWYCLRCLDFMKDRLLVEDTDTYDTTGMTEAEIAAAKVVKYAVATESDDASLLTLKVAGGSAGSRTPLDAETETQLKAYLAEIKDAGVRLLLVNQAADRLKADVSIWYDAQRTEEQVEADCREAVSRYVQDMPFGGEYSHMGLTDALQGVEGVKVVQVRRVMVKAEGENDYHDIDARYVAVAGYLTVDTLDLGLEAY